MANDLNQCNFIGRLGKDPETRYAPSGDAICNFTIAVGWKSKESEGAEWVRISAFGKLAEICGQYLKKGSQVFVSGKFSTRKWTNKDGVDQYTTEIRADQMQMLGGKPEGGEGNPRGQGQASATRTEKPKPSNPTQSSGAGFGEFDDDIPF
ncbi:MAG: single-stranded DNA-binding protein [Xanthomonadales bacterium]|nr:single-stranded DNA-binding protein [Xanthomonadales bacterium]